MVRDLEKRRFIQVGLLAWVILLALAVTSPVLVLRRMGGKNWQRLHRLVYVAAAAGCVHYWWLVKRGVQRPMPDTLILMGLLLARVVWWGLKRRRTVANGMLRPANPVV
jgi:sulfoxide reductase heme-binding subunit YedZ